MEVAARQFVARQFGILHNPNSDGSGLGPGLEIKSIENRDHCIMEKHTS